MDSKELALEARKIENSVMHAIAALGSSKWSDAEIEFLQAQLHITKLLTEISRRRDIKSTG